MLFSSKPSFSNINRTVHKGKSEQDGPLVNIEDITPLAKTVVILHGPNLAQIPADKRIPTINIESAKYFLQRQKVHANFMQ